MIHVRREWPSNITLTHQLDSWYPLCGRDFHDQSELVAESTFVKMDDRCWECAAILGVEEDA